MTRPPTRMLAALVTAVAVLAAGCTSEPADPQARLAEAVERTFTGSFAYRLSAQADRASLASLGEGAGQAAAFLNTFALGGIVDGEVVSLDVHLLVADPVVQLRRFGDDELFVRLGLLDLPLELAGPTRLERDLLAVAEEQNLPASVSEGIESLFAGSWVGIVGEFDAAQLGALAGGLAGGTPGATTTPRPDVRLPDGLPQLVEAYLEVVEEVPDDAERRYDVNLRLRDLLRALADVGGRFGGAAVPLEDLENDLAQLPETVTGRIDTRDGQVTAVRFDVAEAARAGGQDVPGEILLQLDLSDHGEVTRPEVPSDAHTVPSDELAAGLDALVTGLNDRRGGQ